LLATRALSRVRQAIGADLPVSAIFEAPTPAALAHRIETAADTAPPPLARADRGRPLPLSFAQERLWFMDQMRPGPLYNLSFALHLSGDLDVAAWEGAQAALRTRFPAQGGEPVQAIDPPGSAWTQPRIDLGALATAAARAEADRLTQQLAVRPFD